MDMEELAAITALIIFMVGLTILTLVIAPFVIVGRFIRLVFRNLIYLFSDED